MPTKLLKSLFAGLQTEEPVRPLRHKVPQVLAALLVGVLLAAAPRAAEAGPFDCVNPTLDWGCRILSFLFDTSNAPGGNAVTYIKDGTPVEDIPAERSVQGALRAMMAFFSNAMLIIASLKLLYEILQMTAETAHSGRIGGREANTLWAPIRLVVAIGLLVPLSSGLNSGQYIILQVAKWGSGMASQGWVVFAKYLAEDQRLTEPVPGRVYRLSIEVLKSSMCMYLINYYAQHLGTLDADAVVVNTASLIRNGNTARIKFGNRMADEVCGHVDLKLPIIATLRNPDSLIAFDLTEINNEEFNKALADIVGESRKLSRFFLPPGNTGVLPSTDGLGGVNGVIQRYQDSLKAALSNLDVGATAMQEITRRVAQAAEIHGWTSAGTWFLAITRAQGQIFSAGMALPEAKGPDLNVMQSLYRDAHGAYGSFAFWLEKSTRTNEQAAILPSGAPGTGLDTDSFPDQSIQDESRLMRDLNNTGEWAIDGLLGIMDRLAVNVGLWTGDPTRAFGDLGGSRNPFGEIAALGHKKIRLGLNYLGMTLLLQAGSGMLEGAAGLIPSNFTVLQSAFPAWFARMLLSGASKGMAALAAITIMIATLFLLAGVLLGFVVPLFPFVRFFFAILTWLGTLFEGMICLPFLALAHLTPNGQGFTGQNARTGYYLVFQIFLRPVLTLFGLVAAMLLFYVAAKFLNAMFYEATSGIAFYDGGMRFMQKMVYSFVYVGLIYISANLSFKMIEQIPKHALRWMGQQVSEGEFDDSSSFLQVATAVGGQQMISNFTDLPKQTGAVISFPAQAWGAAKADYRQTQVARRNDALPHGWTDRGIDGAPMERNFSTGATDAERATIAGRLHDARDGEQAAQTALDAADDANTRNSTPGTRRALVTARGNLRQAQRFREEMEGLHGQVNAWDGIYRRKNPRYQDGQRYLIPAAGRYRTVQEAHDRLNEIETANGQTTTPRP